MTVDLKTKYLGLELKNPLVAAASPLTGTLGSVMNLRDAGISAVVLPSLFEEQIEHEERAIHDLRTFATDSFAEATSYLPDFDDYATGPDAYLDRAREIKAAVDIPVIGSLNGTSRGGWVRYAKLLEETGVDALELNIYLVSTDFEASSADVEKRYLELVQAVRESVSIPLAVKVGPFFSSIPYMAQEFVKAGANGLVLFNRFLQPDIDLDVLEVAPNLHLSTSEELRLPLRWLAILHGRLEASLAATSGAHTFKDVMKLLLVGADVSMLASVLLRQGIGHVGMLLEGMRAWMEEWEYVSVEQLKGSLSQMNCPDPEAFERANYIKALTSYTGEFL